MARSPCTDSIDCSGARKPETSVLHATHLSPFLRSVLTEWIRRLTASHSAARSKASTLYGAVTLTPSTGSAAENVEEVVEIGGGERQIHGIEPPVSKAALWIAGDTECATGRPTTP